MKKILSVLLVLTLLLGCVSGLAEALPAEEDDQLAIPAAGDVIEGFEVKELRDFPLYGATLVLF